jgi:hypothetical protein
MTLHPAPKAQVTGATLGNDGYIFAGDAWRLGYPPDGGADAQSDAASDAGAYGLAAVDASTDGQQGDRASPDRSSAGSGGGGASNSSGCSVEAANDASGVGAAATALLASLGLVVRSTRKRRS